MFPKVDVPTVMSSLGDADIDNLITTEQIKTFETSPRALDAIKSLGRAISGAVDNSNAN
jgi:hypothetical protein